MIKKRYRIKRKKKYKKKKGRGIELFLNCFIALANLGVNQCNETKKKLRNGKT